MADSYSKLKAQHDKIRSTYERITPPTPDDEFETLRRSVYQEMDRVEGYLQGRISGDGSIQAPSIED